MTKENPTQLWQQKLSRRALLRATTFGVLGLIAAVAVGCESEGENEKLITTFDSIFEQIKASNIDGSKVWSIDKGEAYKFQVGDRLYALIRGRTKTGLADVGWTGPQYRVLEIYEKEKVTRYDLNPDISLAWGEFKPDYVIMMIDKTPIFPNQQNLFVRTGSSPEQFEKFGITGGSFYDSTPIILGDGSIDSLAKNIQQAFKNWQEGNKFGK